MGSDRFFPDERARIDGTDVWVLFALAVLTWAYGAGWIEFSNPPFEDAAMLMRYSGHLARGHGIVWNIGEPALDGATDFLFMLVVAAANRLGASLELAVRGFTLSAHVAAIVLVYVGMRRIQGSGRIAAFSSAAYFALGPGLPLSAAYFGTPVFVLAIMFAWLLAQRLMGSRENSTSDCTAFAVACLLAGLIRPEGVLISVFMLLAVVVAIGWDRSARIAVVFGGVFSMIGGAYFAWRWAHFGYPLPNQFYKKGGGSLYWESLVASIKNSVKMLLPILPAFLLTVRGMEVARLGAAFAIPVAGSIGIWALLSNEMNFGARFQYPVLGLGVLSWYPLVKDLPSPFPPPAAGPLAHPKAWTAFVVVALALVVVLYWQAERSARIVNPPDGRYTTARMLSDYADRGYTMATTEAGLLPFYSRWRAIDTWGLNDAWIAHNGGKLTENYLAQQEPDLIVWHGDFSPGQPSRNERSGAEWFHQVRVLRRYAEANNFTLAAAFGATPYDTHYYYVGRNVSDHDEIVRRIRSSEYRWFRNGQIATNYALSPKP